MRPLDQRHWIPEVRFLSLSCHLFEAVLTWYGSAWRWPEIPGIETFGGEMYHTAQYREGLDLKGKTVAVIGAGSSGIQVVASIYDEVDKLYTWVRSPTWITAAFGQAYAGKDGRNFECKSPKMCQVLQGDQQAETQSMTRFTGAEGLIQGEPHNVSSVQEDNRERTQLALQACAYKHSRIGRSQCCSFCLLIYLPTERLC